MNSLSFEMRESWSHLRLNAVPLFVWIKKQAMYIKRKVEARSCKHFCSRKSAIIIYPESVILGLRIQHAMSMLHNVICGLPDCKIFFHIVS